MCGVSGVFSMSGEPVQRRDVEALNASIAHRGPDGEGIWQSQDGLCILGHRRLAIIDTDARSNQPMLSDDHNLVIAFNGEIYNFLEVRSDLEARGHRFRTESDTEVIIAAWRQWGSDMQFRFNGMWAIAIYDCVQRQLFITRDRFGEKPLFYMQVGGHFVFASEMNALAALPSAHVDIDIDVVERATFETHSIEASERTLYRQVRRLPPGHLIEVSQSGLRVCRWWKTIDHLVAAPPTLEQAAEEFWSRFQDAVKICMRADVPIGTCLSGGFDSSAIVGVMGMLASGGASSNIRQAADWRHAFVATFPGMSNDETPEAKMAAAYAGIDSVSLIDMTKSSALDYLEEGMAALEGISLSVPTAGYLIYKAVREGGVTVSIDGHGADEMLGAYRQQGQNIRFWLRNLAGNSSGKHHSFNRLSDHMKLRVLSYQNNMFLRNRRAPPSAFEIAAHSDTLPSEWGNLNRRLYGMFHATVLPTLMRNFDRMSMAHGVEVRSPFLDWRLATFVFSLPEAMKSNPQYSKLVAREALRGRMPEAIRSSPVKKGFSSQMPEWLNSELGTWAADQMARPNDAFDTIVDTNALRKRINELNQSASWTWEIGSRIWPYVHAKWFCDRYA
jgi:asparagine synthase (glutamine-hydrolysing)